MWNLLIIASVLVICFFVWMKMDYARRQKKNKRPFRTEDDLESYEKKMKDQDDNPVNFDDAE